MIVKIPKLEPIKGFEILHTPVIPRVFSEDELISYTSCQELVKDAQAKFARLEDSLNLRAQQLFEEKQKEYDLVIEQLKDYHEKEYQSFLERTEGILHDKFYSALEQHEAKVKSFTKMVENSLYEKFILQIEDLSRDNRLIELIISILSDETGVNEDEIEVITKDNEITLSTRYGESIVEVNVNSFLRDALKCLEKSL